jgi:hypothetical protein
MTTTLEHYSVDGERGSVARLRMLVSELLAADADSIEEERAVYGIDQFGFDQTALDSLLVEKPVFTAEIAALSEDDAPDSPHAATQHLLRALQGHCCGAFLDYCECFAMCDDEKTERVIDFAEAIFRDGPVSCVLQPTREDRLKAATILGGRLGLGLAHISRLLGLSRGSAYRALQRARASTQAMAIPAS